MKIAHFTDLHLEEAFPFEDSHRARNRLDTILKNIAGENITQLICTGDIGEKKGIPYFFEQVKSQGLRLTLGNHDQFSEISKYYQLGAHYDSKKIYSSELKEFHKFIYLDSSEGIIDDAQLTWLTKELISPKPILLFLHHPLLGLDLKVDEIGRLRNRTQVIDLLTKANLELTIFCGHYHLESTQIYQNIRQYITPAVAFQIKKNPSAIEIDTSCTAYRIIEIEQGDLSTAVKFFHCAD